MADKYYLYVDETWRDEGTILIMGVVVAKGESGPYTRLCESIEGESGKGRTKWIKAGHKRKMEYIRSVLGKAEFKGLLAFEAHPGRCNYMDALAQTLGKILVRFEGAFTIQVDGLSRTNARGLGIALRKAGFHSVNKVRGGRDESEALLRLADALCGLVGMAYEGSDEARKLLEDCLAKEVIVELE